MMQLMLSPLAQTIFSIVAVLCYVACAFRILCFDRLHLQKCSFRLFAVVLNISVNVDLLTHFMTFTKTGKANMLVKQAMTV